MSFSWLKLNKSAKAWWKWRIKTTIDIHLILAFLSIHPSLHLLPLIWGRVAGGSSLSRKAQTSLSFYLFIFKFAKQPLFCMCSLEEVGYCDCMMEWKAQHFWSLNIVKSKYVHQANFQTVNFKLRWAEQAVCIYYSWTWQPEACGLLQSHMGPVEFSELPSTLPDWKRMWDQRLPAAFTHPPKLRCDYWKVFSNQ